MEENNMKKKLLAVLLMSALFMTACGGKDSGSNPSDVGDSAEENQEQTSVEEDSVKSKALAGVFPAGEELVEIPMGTYSDVGQTDYCTVKLPSNYIGGAVSALSLSEEKSFDMFSGSDSVTSALEQGLVENENSISYMVISNQESDTTKVYLDLMCAEKATYETFKNMSVDYTEIGNSENPALYYVDESSYAMGDMRLVYSVNPEIILVIDYAGPLCDELGIDAIAENLYNIIEAI